MAQATNGRARLEENAHSDPYAFMESEDTEWVAENMEIIPLDAASDENELPSDMSWTERHIGGGGLLTVTDYGRHRSECDNLAEFREFIREKLKDGMGSQYLKIMDDDKERVAETLLAVTKADGYVVVPYFEE